MQRQQNMRRDDGTMHIGGQEISRSDHFHFVELSLFIHGVPEKYVIHRNQRMTVEIGECFWSIM